MGDAIEIRPLVAADAPQLTACFERCYGNSYVAGFFYDPAAICARIADGRLQSVVAVAASGEIVGHMALTGRHAGALTVEAGNTVVDPRCRGQGIAPRLGAALFQACRAGGWVGFHHYPTTAHAIMQKLAVEGGGVETGVMLSYIPADTDYKDLGGKSQAGRLAVVVVYQPIAPAPPREVFLPERYASLLAAMYERARLTRTFSTPASAFPSPGSRVGTSRDDSRSLLRLDVDSVAGDLCERVDAARRTAPSEITHVDLPLGDPATPLAVEALRARGFCFCALLPEFSAAGDVLRLQQPGSNFAVPDLVYPEARAILELALVENERR